MILLAVALLAQAADVPPMAMGPATAAAIRAGGRACVGATVDPAGEDARVAGWSPATPAQRAGVQSDGQVLTRDNVLLMVKPGIEGGCVVMATVDGTFDRTAFNADLGQDLGVVVSSDPKNPVTKLANGEVLVAMLTAEGGTNRVMLVVGNPASHHGRNREK